MRAEENYARFRFKPAALRAADRLLRRCGTTELLSLLLQPAFASSEEEGGERNTLFAEDLDIGADYRQRPLEGSLRREILAGGLIQADFQSSPPNSTC